MNTTVHNAQILDFVRHSDKEETKDNSAEASTFVAIFNMANHRSLLAATLFALTMRAFEKNYNVQMVDIRDYIPRSAKNYIWIDAGTPEDYEKVVRNLANTLKNMAEEKAWFENLKSKSHVLASKAEITELSSSCFGAVSKFLDLGAIDGIDVENAKTPVVIEGYTFPEFIVKASVMLKKLFVLSMAFEDNSVHHNDYSMYYKILVEAYNAYHGKTITLDSFFDLVWNAQPDTPDDFQEYQANIAKLMAFKVTRVVIKDSYFYQLSSLGPDVWALLRRIKLSKKKPVHVTVCPIGNVVYTTEALPENIELMKETLFLSSK